MSKEWRYRLGGRTGQLVVDSLLGTTSHELIGDRANVPQWTPTHPCVLALWHGRLLPLSYTYRGNGLVPIISRSGDGEYVTRLMKGWGYEPVRGSSSRGGSKALRQMLQLSREGRKLVFTVDGPRGPREEVKPGVVVAAQLTGIPIIPASAAATRAWWLGGWDRFCVPKPFARIVTLFGDPIHVPRDLPGDGIAHYVQLVKHALDALTREADRAVA